MEWNVRVSGARNPDVIDKIDAVFESYWAERRLRPLRRRPSFSAPRPSGHASDDQATHALSPIEIRLEPFQERLLELIAVSRDAGHHRNLLVSATGTGKTVMAAVDYARLASDRCLGRGCCSSLTARRSSIRAAPPSGTRCATTPSARSGSAAQRPEAFEHVFASIQSLNAAGLEHLAAGPFRRRHRRRVPPRCRPSVPGAARAPRSRASCSA